MTIASDAAARLMSDSVMPPTPAQHDRDLDLVLRQLGDLVLERLERAGHVGLEHEAELLDVARAGRRSSPASVLMPRRRACCSSLSRFARSPASERALRSFSTTRTYSPASGTVSKPEHLDRLGRAGRLDALARVVGHRAHAAPVGAGDDRVADLQRAALDEHGDDRAAARIELGLDHGAGGLGVRVGGELLDLGHQQQALEQVVEALRASWPRRRRTSCRRPTPRAGARAGSSRCARGRAARPPCRSC